MVKVLLVGGTFGNEPHSSKVANSIFDKFVETTKWKAKRVNGGTIGELQGALKDALKMDVIVWLANVDNDEEKLINSIKKIRPHCLLVTSKRNFNGEYTFQDIIYHALGIKSNLMLEIYKDLGGRYVGRILDPLGNCFRDTQDFEKIGQVIGQRVRELSGYTRVGSASGGKARKIPNEERFFQTVKDHADIFHNCIHPHPEAANRFFGNASFRCGAGFPSYRQGKLIYVSKRNVDKRFIDASSFVAVNPEFKHGQVVYYGKEKPSVDTPIQLILYDYYKNARYMLHSHAYVLGGEFTKGVIPCGNIEEADEITSLYHSKQKVNFRVNLNGHGSIVIADNVEFFKKTQYFARSQPEYMVLKAGL